jgi:hypothetical protein
VKERELIPKGSSLRYENSEHRTQNAKAEKSDRLDFRMQVLKLILGKLVVKWSNINLKIKAKSAKLWNRPKADKIINKLIILKFIDFKILTDTLKI